MFEMLSKNDFINKYFLIDSFNNNFQNWSVFLASTPKCLASHSQPMRPQLTSHPDLLLVVSKHLCCILCINYNGRYITTKIIINLVNILVVNAVAHLERSAWRIGLTTERWLLGVRLVYGRPFVLLVLHELILLFLELLLDLLYLFKIDFIFDIVLVLCSILTILSFWLSFLLFIVVWLLPIDLYLLFFNAFFNLRAF